MKFIDLSIPIINANEMLFDIPKTQPKITYSTHEEGAIEMSALYMIKSKEYLPDGKGWASESLTLSTHSGTHMDAPWHYAPIQDKEIGERKALTIDEFPLEWGIGPLIVLDCTDFEDGYVMTVEDINKKLEDINYKLQTGDILCIHTNASKFAGTKEYTSRGVGVGREATLHIVRQGIHVVGIDAWSWDAPITFISNKWKKMVKVKAADPSIIWEGHFAGIQLGYFQMEKLTNLDKVPAVGATIYCFPIKIGRASAGWVRAVATIPE